MDSPREVTTPPASVDLALDAMQEERQTIMVARSNSSLITLLERAHAHVEMVIQKQGPEAAMEEPTSASSSILQFLRRKKQMLRNRMARLTKTDRTSRVSLDARYERLQKGHAMLCSHLEEALEHQMQLCQVLRGLSHASQSITQSMLASATGAGASPSLRCRLRDSFAQTPPRIEDLVNVLELDVATQTTAKIELLQHFQQTLHQRDALKLDLDVLHREIAHLSRDHKQQHKQQHQSRLQATQQQAAALRFQLDTMSKAVEQVFQFHAQIDPVAVGPELQLIQQHLSRFFQDQARAFE